MDWSPFSNIRYGVKKNRARYYVLFFLFLVFSVAPAYYYLTEDYTGNALTTNIDFENKRIIDEADLQQENRKNPISFPNFINQIYKKLSRDALQLLTLANPETKYVKIHSGLRREEIANIFANALNWNKNNKEKFENLESRTLPNREGYYYPGVYIVRKDTPPEKAADLMLERFNQEVSSRYQKSTSEIISIETALKVASIIEREAAGKNDRRLISGIVWNRIFSGMNLEIDATLQYAKGSEEKGWWPKVTPKDKLIDSPYNTYQNEGFPPSPISNTSIAAISAALNPQKTKCLFYLHDSKKQIHCSKTYEEHKQNVRRYLIGK